MDELEGPRLRAAIAERFGLDLADAPTMVTLRGWTNDRDGYIHCDSTAKRVTVLLYLNPATDAWAQHEGCLRLLRGPDDLEDYAVEVPPVNGTLLVFPNGAERLARPQALHRPALLGAAQLHDHGRQGAQRTATAPDVGVHEAADPGGLPSLTKASCGGKSRGKPACENDASACLGGTHDR